MTATCDAAPVVRPTVMAWDFIVPMECHDGDTENLNIRVKRDKDAVDWRSASSEAVKAALKYKGEGWRLYDEPELEATYNEHGEIIMGDEL